jgi:hypothetical protein
MKIKDWVFEQLDSGHWIATYQDRIESPLYCRKHDVRKWVSNYVRKQKEPAHERE